MNTPSLLSDTPAFRFQTWAAFLLSLGATSVGIWFLDVDGWVRAFLALGLWFTVSSSLSLAKAVRDHHEREKLSGQLTEHKTEQILREMAKAA